MRFRDLSVLSKILALLVLLGAVAVGAMALTGERLKETDRAYGDLIDGKARAAGLYATANRQLAWTERSLLQLIWSTAQDTNDLHKAEYIDGAKAFESLLVETRTLLPQQANEIQGFEQRFHAAFSDGCDKAMSMGAASTTLEGNARAMAEMNRSCAPELALLAKDITASSALLLKDVALEKTAIGHATHNMILLTYGLVLVGLAVGFGIAVLVARSGITNPIRTLINVTETMAKGVFNVTVPGVDRRDELGAMARAVEVFRQGLAETEMLRSSRDQTTAAEAKRLEKQRRAEAEAAEHLRFATSNLGDGLKRLASGDLSFRLTDAFAPDFEMLRHDFNRSLEQLSTTLSRISSSIATLDSGSREIADGANDLSKRTEHQAASLEETAAALDEITANVSNSTKRTEEARSVAAQANQSAIRSAEVVTQAEEAMRKIEGSSQQISNIIGVIDDIAFQTNLLALNAGVEAARAGDAGRGFAVVAQEVRELAQRSANAAKEIKNLIQNSSTEVEGGVKLVRGTGEALKTIAGYIAQITTQVESIAISAKEQSVGLGEVNTAVNSMDQVTQQNAAMVEESNAATSSLVQEAAKLRDLVDQFDLGNVSAPQAFTVRMNGSAMAGRSLHRLESR
ncbi:MULTISPECIES: methyl-accepting chemotaxis protein [unclassified Rhizobium]